MNGAVAGWAELGLFILALFGGYFALRDLVVTMKQELRDFRERLCKVENLAAGTEHRLTQLETEHNLLSRQHGRVPVRIVKIGGEHGETGE